MGMPNKFYKKFWSAHKYLYNLAQLHIKLDKVNSINLLNRTIVFTILSKYLEQLIHQPLFCVSITFKTILLHETQTEVSS